MTANAVTAGAMFAVALPLCLALSQGSLLPVVALPGLLLVFAAFAVGVGLLVSALNVYFRDVEHILQAISLPWIFVTPIFYTFAAVPGLADRQWAQDLLHYANPVAPPVLAIQDALFWGRWPDAGDVVYMVVAAGRPSPSAGWRLPAHGARDGGGAVSPLEPGRIALRGVSRSFRVLHERNMTLKETVLRRRRTHATELWALRDVNLDVAPGEALGVIGQNGSGKSTLLKVLAGIIPPNSGTVAIGGQVASMLELGAGFHPDFSGRENVYMNGAIHGLSERQIDAHLEEIVAFAELEEFVEMPVRTYSSGMQMRLAFAVAAHVNPDVLLLDEVLAVGDEAFQRKCFGRIFDFRRRGGTLVFVSHDAGGRRARVRPSDPAAGRRGGGGRAAGRRAAGVPPHAGGAGRCAAAAERHARARTRGREWGTGGWPSEECGWSGPTGPTDRFVSGEPFAIEMDCGPGSR